MEATQMKYVVVEDTFVKGKPISKGSMITFDSQDASQAQVMVELMAANRIRQATQEEVVAATKVKPNKPLSITPPEAPQEPAEEPETKRRR